MKIKMISEIIQNILNNQLLTDVIENSKISGDNKTATEVYCLQAQRESALNILMQQKDKLLENYYKELENVQFTRNF